MVSHTYSQGGWQDPQPALPGNAGLPARTGTGDLPAKLPVLPPAIATCKKGRRKPRICLQDVLAEAPSSQTCAGNKQRRKKVRKASCTHRILVQISSFCASDDGCRAGKGTVNRGLALFQPLASISLAGSRLGLGREDLGKDCALRPNELLCG